MPQPDIGDGFILMVFYGLALVVAGGVVYGAYCGYRKAKSWLLDTIGGCRQQKKPRRIAGWKEEGRRVN